MNPPLPHSGNVATAPQPGVPRTRPTLPPKLPPLAPLPRPAAPSTDVPSDLAAMLTREAHVAEKARELTEREASLRAEIEAALKASPFKCKLRRLLSQPESDPRVIALQARCRSVVSEARGVGEELARRQREVEERLDAFLYHCLPYYREPVDRQRQRARQIEKAKAVEAAVKALIADLGQARNMAASGYDKKAGALSRAAVDLLRTAATRAQQMYALLIDLSGNRNTPTQTEYSLSRMPGMIVGLEHVPLAQLSTGIAELVAEIETKAAYAINDATTEAVSGLDPEYASAKAYRDDYLRALRLHAISLVRQ